MKANRLLSGLIISLMSTSCYVYHPQTTDIPLIREKSDLRIDAGVSFVQTVHSTISYGLTNKVAIQAFGSLGSESKKYFQLAPGLYKNNINKSMVMELYGGFGYGYGDAYKDINPGNLYGNYQLYFLQCNIGKYSIKSSHTDFGFGIKTGLFHSNLIDHNFYHRGTEEGPFINYKENSILIEPLVSLKVGGENLKLSFKFGGCWILKLTHPDIYIPTSKLNFGVGINFSTKKNKGDLKQ